MATRKEILSDLSSKIAAGNIREAYRDFEELPVVDQIAVSISPGVGDAIAAYEVAEFGRRAKTNIQDKDRLGAAGNIALSALAGISLIPLFRVLRGAKAVAKTGTKVAEAPKKTDKPPVEEPLQLSAPKDQPEIELPEVLPFVTKPAKDLAYQTTQFALPLQSKARKFLHGHYKKLDPDINLLTPEDWVKTLTNPNNEIPLGELRILNVLDELNQIHPKLIKEAAGSEKISKGFLDNYMARQQRDALQIRNSPPSNLESRAANFVRPELKTSAQEKLYFVRGAGEQRTNSNHYKNLRLQNDNAIYPNNVPIQDAGNLPQRISGDNAYVFDGVGQFRVLPTVSEAGLNTRVSDEITEKLDKIGVKDDDVFDSIFRVQSDYMMNVRELGPDVSKNFVNPKTEAEKVKKIIRYNKFVDEINPILANTRSMDTLASSTITRMDATSDVKKLGVDEFTLEPKDIEAITGRSYKESLDKTPEEIFYMLDETGKKQKYVDVPNNPEALSQAYFKDLYKDNKAFIDLQNGARILKKAIVPKTDFANKFKIDPYFEKSTSNEMKLPVRTRVLEAVLRGSDGIHIGDAQAKNENAGKVIIEKYARGEKEIQNILNELGLGNKKKELTTRITGTNSEYDGTFLKFSDEFKKAVDEQGINAFKLGGPVDIDKMLAEL
jgi:hypothetical protein